MAGQKRAMGTKDFRELKEREVLEIKFTKWSTFYDQ
jgi:hypothetical protein